MTPNTLNASAHGSSATPIALDRPSTYLLSSFLLFGLGSVLNIVAYGTLAPIAAAAFFYLFGVVSLSLIRAGGQLEQDAFRLVFSVSWFWAGVAALYANFLNDPNQNTSDAAGFFALASGQAAGLDLERIRQLTVGAGAVALWRAVYDLFAAVGFEKGRYIGVSVNVFLVSMAAVTGVKMTRLAFGHDAKRLRRFVLLYASCGIFWLFAAIHLRDAGVLFVASALALYWVRYLGAPSSSSLAWLVAASLASIGAFAFLRLQFIFVPFAMLAAGLAAIVLASTSSRKQRRRILYSAVLVSAVLFSLVAFVQTDLIDTLLRGNAAYSELSAKGASEGSLGLQFVVNAPLLVRLTIGSAYILIFPIPVWSGFGAGSAYLLFKSFHVLFMYLLIPLLALTIWHVAQRKRTRTAPLLFLVFVPVGFLLAVAATSLETRHFGVFLVPALVAATLPDLRDRSERARFGGLAAVFLASMLIVHIAWASLKLL